jgi:hypothetical protein
MPSQLGASFDVGQSKTAASSFRRTASLFDNRILSPARPIDLISVLRSKK